MPIVPNNWKRLIGFCASALCLLVASAVAAPPVTVHLQSGRSFTGYVDLDTSPAELVLRVEMGRSTLWRPIAWDRVVSAEIDGRRISAAEFQAETSQWKSIAVEEVAPPADPFLDETPNPPPTSAPATTAPSLAKAMSGHGEAFERVHSIAVRAELANWNAGAEMDGLLVTVWPLGADGRVLAVSGTIEAQLIGLRGASARSMYSYARGNPFPRLGEWKQSVRQNDFGPDGVQLKLPFQAIQPEFNTQFAPFGSVLVKMAIPGHGVFSDTVNLVRIRPYSPLRDVREQLGLPRFFADEELTRTQ